jgi:hypothetical protein
MLKDYPELAKLAAASAKAGASAPATKTAAKN